MVAARTSTSQQAPSGSDKTPSGTPGSSGGPAVQLKRDLRGMSFDAGAAVLAPVQKKDGAAKLSQDKVDATFNAWWAQRGKKPDAVEWALQKTREQVGAGMPEGYQPPPIREKAAAAPAASAEESTAVSDSAADSGDAMCGGPNQSLPPDDLATGKCEDPSLSSGSGAPNMTSVSGEVNAHPHTNTSGTPSASNKIEGEKGYGYGPFGLTFKAGSEGMAGELSAAISKSFPIPTSVPGLFANFVLSGKAVGSAALKADGSFEGSVGVEGEALASINYGIPKVASVYGGGKVKLEVKGITASRDAKGKWTVTWPLASLKVALALGAQLDVELGDKGAPPGSWSPTMANKFEWNPGGEFELLRIGHINGEWTAVKGADVDRLVKTLDELKSWGTKIITAPIDAFGKTATEHKKMTGDSFLHPGKI